jgi:hypothetical protein
LQTKHFFSRETLAPTEARLPDLIIPTGYRTA